MHKFLTKEPAGDTQGTRAGSRVQDFGLGQLDGQTLHSGCAFSPEEEPVFSPFRRTRRIRQLRMGFGFIGFGV